MKFFLVAASLLAVLMSSAYAKTNWQGEVMVLGVSNCAVGGDQIGDNYLATYQPKNGGTIVDNSTLNFLSILGRRNAFSIKFASLTAGVAYSGVYVSGRGHHLTVSGNISSISTTPATVGASTPTLVINAVITNWLATPGCTATIRGAFVKRVDAP